MAKIDKSVYIVFGVFGIFLFTINYLFPTQSDDLGTDFGGLSGAINMYMNWNGRFGELLRTAFIGALAPTLFFKITNTIVGIVFILSWFVIIYARLPRNFNDSVILALSILCLLFFSAFGSIFIWAAGCLNYLWAYTLVLLVCIPYRIFWFHYFNHHKIIPQSYSSLMVIGIIGFCIASFCAGMSNEITGIIVVILHICILCYAIFIAKIKLPLWYYAGMLFFFLGFLALYFSPGHAKRAALFIELNIEYYSIGDFLHMSIYEKIARINKVVKSTSTTFIVFVCLLLCFIYERLQQKKWKSTLFIPVLGLVYGVIFLIPTLHFIRHLIGALFFIVTCYYIFWIYRQENNAKLSQLYYYAFLLFIICHICLLLTLQVNIPVRARLFVVLMGIMGFILIYKIMLILLPQAQKKIQGGIFTACVLYAVFVMSAYIDMHIKWNKMAAYIEEQKSKGIKDIVVDSAYFHSYYRRYGDWQNPDKDVTAFPNPSYANYFGVHTFRVK